MNNVSLINGPNLNMLGIREIEIYGSTSYETLIKDFDVAAKKLGFNVEIFQSNIEGELVQYIQKLSKLNNNWIIINPGAYTHTSIALRDALSIFIQNNKVVEVHVSSPNNRESFRKINLIEDLCEKSFVGLGIQGYFEALRYISEHL
ncbi:MAG: 3-dehydroquinate dehydratase [Actinomycetota bacterium]|nr:3-dehydroquinate dehydratase [Actinomycetota bacterium]MDA3013704.1 3-dehydroquinate dehydratase [Actinomycetota bacterium]